MRSSAPPTLALRTLAAFGLLALTLSPPGQAGARDAGRPAAPARTTPAEEALRERVNSWSVSLAGGLLEGAPIRFATEIARAVEGGVHVLPVVTRGPTDNVNDLLYLRGIDMAIINGDSLDEYRAQVPQIGSRIVQIVNLFPSELHVFVRPGIDSIADLAGKKVNFNTAGTAAAYSGPLIFSRLGIEVQKTFVPHPTALAQLRTGEMDAVVFITAKPVDAFVKGKWDGGFKFLPVEFGPKLADYYVRTELTSDDYPALIPPGGKIASVAVPTVLVSYNWKPGTARYERVARFVDELFGHADRLRAPGFDPRWKTLDLTAVAPGMDRFKPAQDWLDRKVADRDTARSAGAGVKP